MIDNNFTKKAQIRLLVDLDENTKRLNSLKLEDPFSDTDRLNDNAAVDADALEQTGHERVQALKKELLETIVRIKRALSKIDDSEYGVCENCGEVIDLKRLEIFPMATLCFKCERRKE